jgi:glycine oxidase
MDGATGAHQTAERAAAGAADRLNLIRVMPAQGGWSAAARREERHMANHNRNYDAIFVGAGVIGLASAWRAARRGERVCVLERDNPAAGATGVAAGMLAPVGEASWGEENLLALNQESLRRWPGFAAELEADSDSDVEFAQRGALHIALDRDEAEELRRRYELHRSLGLDSEWLRGRDCRALEPGLSTAVRGGALVSGEASVDPRRLVAALLSALERRGVEVHSGAEVVRAERRAGGWRLETADARSFDARVVVVTSGCWSGRAAWLPEELRPPVRPVKGEILTLRGDPSEPVCERIVAGERVYIVPRADGRLIVGATVEERGFDTIVTAGGIHELLREAYRLIPEIAEVELAETSAGLRPGTPDNAPVIGPSATEGLFIATGHYRNGVLQAPVTAESVAALISGESPPVDLEPFSAARFAAGQVERPMEVR